MDLRNIISTFEYTKTDKVMRIVIYENGVKKIFNTDEEFLKFAQDYYRDNEDGNSEIHWLPDNIYNAVEYISEYTELELIEE